MNKGNDIMRKKNEVSSEECYAGLEGHGMICRGKVSADWLDD